MGDAFLGALRLLAGCEGKVVVTGVGKSGHIGRKIAASLASTGTPAFFVHSDEALHGDSGMVGPEDVVVAISNSGETAEVLAFLAILRGIGAPVIAMTGRSGSTLARQAGAVLDVGVAREADPLGLAPTASTVATLAMGDALVSALMALGNFSRKDFARFHPGGALGNMLLTSGEGG
ncbi:MAG: SIS domain-containing protein [Firmicutes bacterium]|nr:SIS domain-containing protein [Bacillota bacterium]